MSLFKMLSNTLSITILLIFFHASYPPTKALIAPLFPPLAPQSPFYTQILEANNISTTTTNITLDRNHYMKWYLSKFLVSPNEKSEQYFLRDAGIHVINMYMGTPKQLMYGMFDTGTGLTWFQCKNVAYKSKFPFYNQSKSLTYKIIKCDNKEMCYTRYKAIEGCNDLGDICEFKVTYQDGTNAYGEIATDSTTFKWPKDHVLLQFNFGCSWDNSIKMMGVVGASNYKYSLPRQLYPNDPKFSYCITSNFNSTNAVMFGPDAILKGYIANMFQNPYFDYYYIDVYGISVNGKHLAVGPTVFRMSSSGLRGFIIDSGTTLTYLTSEAFEILKRKITQLRGPPTSYFIFEICYKSSKSEDFFLWKTKPIIGLEIGDSLFEFEENKLWQDMVISEDKLECLQIVRTRSLISILGSMLLFDVNVGLDPNNNLLYLQKTSCPTI